MNQVISWDLLHSKTVDFIRKELAGIIQKSVETIDAHAAMETFGIKPVMQLTQRLEKRLGWLPKTLFFEYANLSELAAFLIRSHPQGTLEMAGLDPSLPVTGIPLPGPSGGPVPAEEPGRELPLDIAIIGLSGRYPMAGNPDEFWEKLLSATDCITTIPRERWDHTPYYQKEKNTPNKSNSKWGGFIRGVDEFDPLFFRIAPLDAEFMDPQERLFLQCAHETLEDAGYTPESLDRQPRDAGSGPSVGVFVGTMYAEYGQFGARLFANPASIANRVSSCFNFSGPSMTIDTMCASSLTTIHLACRSIRANECRMAIAGGVNISIHPNKYLMLGRLRLSSSNGKCLAFGKGGDGFVPGEGVGAVLLKPLANAEKDQDHIYGVIKASAINHSGRNRGYFVPNPNAQARVIAKAFAQSGIPYRAVSYIEAHGTGTALGDPVEMAGLEKAFQEQTQDLQFCSIGSVKSNIGHCEGAAGIAGVTKVLLQLRHRTLAPTLHTEPLNPNIDFSRTPFKVQQKAGQWTRPEIDIDGETQVFPRIAGVSAFGAGGSNAHILIQEYEEETKVLENKDNAPCIIVLSAETTDKLRRLAQRFLKAASQGKFDTYRLRDIAWTLRNGRTVHAERLGFVARDIRDMIHKLRAFLEEPGAKGIFQGNARKKETRPSLSSDADSGIEAESPGSDRTNEQDITTVIRKWVCGEAPDRALPDPDRPCRKVSLPTYPFAREKWWVPPTELRIHPVDPPLQKRFLHPLIHENCSDLAGPRFLSVFSGKEPFLKEHVVNGKSILPASAYLEMVRAALSLLIHDTGRAAYAIHDISWAAPFVADQKENPLFLDFSVIDETRVEFHFSSGDESPENSASILCQGRASLLPDKRTEPIDLTAVVDVCDSASISKSSCYTLFDSAGIEYGPAFQCIDRLCVGEKSVLAELSLQGPGACGPNAGKADLLLDPGLLDAAFQGTMALVTDAKALGRGETPEYRPGLAFSMEEVLVFKKPGPLARAWIRVTPDRESTLRDRFFDIDITDPLGEVSLQIKGFCARTPAGRGKRPTDREEKEKDVMLVPVLERILSPDAAPAEADRDGTTLLVNVPKARQPLFSSVYKEIESVSIGPNHSDRGRTIEQIAEILGSLESIRRVFFCAPASPPKSLDCDDLIRSQEYGLFPAFRLVKALEHCGYGEKTLEITLFTFRAHGTGDLDLDPTHASLHGFSGAAAKEFPGWKWRVLDLDREIGPGLDTMLSLPFDPDGDPVLMRNGQWFRPGLAKVSRLSPQGDAFQGDAFQKEGVYVLIGGSGGIGRTLSQYLIREFRARVFLDRKKPPFGRTPAASCPSGLPGTGTGIHPGRRVRPGKP